MSQHVTTQAPTLRLPATNGHLKKLRVCIETQWCCAASMPRPRIHAAKSDRSPHHARVSGPLRAAHSGFRSSSGSCVAFTRRNAHLFVIRCHTLLGVPHVPVEHWEAVSDAVDLHRRGFDLQMRSTGQAAHLRPEADVRSSGSRCALRERYSRQAGYFLSTTAESGCHA